jgi:hypothetical protein
MPRLVHFDGEIEQRIGGGSDSKPLNAFSPIKDHF